MEQLSVNGKTFDEISAQRGDVVSINSLKDGEVYHFDQSGKWGWNWIAQYQKRFSVFDIPFSAAISIEEEGIDTPFYDAGGGGINIEDLITVRKATTDQIDLLNLYKTKSHDSTI